MRGASVAATGRYRQARRPLPARHSSWRPLPWRHSAVPPLRLLLRGAAPAAGALLAEANEKDENVWTAVCRGNEWREQALRTSEANGDVAPRALTVGLCRGSSLLDLCDGVEVARTGMRAEDAQDYPCYFL